MRAQPVEAQPMFHRPDLGAGKKRAEPLSDRRHMGVSRTPMQSKEETVKMMTIERTPQEARTRILMNAMEYEALNALANAMTCSDPKAAGMLLGELDRATVYPTGALPDQTVTMNSVVEYVDEVSGRIRFVELVFPNGSDMSSSKVSITSPVGIALIGLSIGDTIMCRFANGRQRRLRVLGVSQPGRSAGS